MVQWLGYCASTAGGLTLIPGWELRSHKVCSGVKKINKTKIPFMWQYWIAGGKKTAFRALQTTATQGRSVWLCRRLAFAPPLSSPSLALALTACSPVEKLWKSMRSGTQPSAPASIFPCQLLPCWANSFISPDLRFLASEM